MKANMWSVAAFIGLLVVGAAAQTTKEAARTNTEALEVVAHGQMSVARAGHQATVVPTGQVLVTGGCAGRQCSPILASAELYDPMSRSFRGVGQMLTPRVSHVAVSFADGRVLVAGGWTSGGTTARAEVYDPAQGRFTGANAMSVARASHVAVPLPDGRALIIGGEIRTGVALSSAEVFDPATLSFATAKGMQTPRSFHVGVPLADGRVLVAGGLRAKGDILRSAEIFDPATGEFRTTGSMTVPRYKHAAAVLKDGRVLIVGGSDGKRERISSTEVFDPATGRFSPAPSLRWPRYKIPDAVAVLPSGAVLVAGGAVRLELWHPPKGNFVAVEGQLDGLQEFATASILRTGEVLVLGGYDEQIRSSSSAWLVRPAR
jgi:hypothetical protein